MAPENIICLNELEATHNLERYSRQLLVQGWGLAQQTRLTDLRILVDTRYPSAAMYLVGAGARQLLLLGDDSGELERLTAMIAGLDKNAQVVGTVERTACDIAIVDHFTDNDQASLFTVVLERQAIQVRFSSSGQIDTFPLSETALILSDLLTGSIAACLVLKLIQYDPGKKR